MKHVEYYVAEDGTRFNDRLDCEAYEARQEFHDIEKHLRVFDSDMEPMDVGAIDDTKWQNDAWYYIIYDDIGYKYLDKCTEWTGIDHPSKPNGATEIYPLIFEYKDCNEYIDIQAMYNKYKRKYDKLTHVKKGE